MTDSARVALLDLRTVAPYRRQLVLTPLLVVAIMFNRPEAIVPGLILLCASTTAGYPFMVSDRADLETLYAVLPLTRRSLLLGHYLWALAVFAVTAGLGTPAALILARQQHIAFTGHAVATVVALSWTAFALAVSIQFPLFVRFGFTKPACWPRLFRSVSSQSSPAASTFTSHRIQRFWYCSRPAARHCSLRPWS